MSDDPKTIPEQLDAAETGEEFGLVINGLFAALERAKDAASETDDHHVDVTWVPPGTIAKWLGENP